MNIQQLDYIFPFIVFFYGLIYLFISESKVFAERAQDVMGTYHEKFVSHRPLAWISLFVGGLWSLQNLWFS